ncbi:[NiFe]-hydrogenase assembly chaperone HybE [Motiliproteus sp. MSK22-1]|uniref:[NiFe]-hydrogenase assembly chaperone HybE n=1 Tax=Motiliproteus sp. MSK22-1 TaxID=1897630 RepID=UPI000977FC3F|nr:[NiFe]-hydrogenase assembly chaperone HybE [Motiliproteus sp. MSK22-1]OMH32117.1 hypothetical protein BGP75_15580 [Motiliproteus sp. MSK22-1]
MSHQLGSELDSDTHSAFSAGFKDNPSKVLEDLYQQVYEKDMKGLPISNPAIQVEAVGFRVWEGHWVGVMVTPWFINLLILWRQGEDWPELKLNKGNDLAIAFPSGLIKFTPRFEPELGYYLCCSLASPMGEFVSHTQAVNSAVEVMKQLTAIPLVYISGDQQPVAVQDPLPNQQRPLTERLALAQEQAPEKSLSRRGFLRAAAAPEFLSDKANRRETPEALPGQVADAREILAAVEASLKKPE